MYVSTIDKKAGNKRTLTTRSLYELLGQNIFHNGMSAFAHDFGEEIQVGYYELGSSSNTWVLKEDQKLMFGEMHMSSSTSKKDQYAETFMKILGQCGACGNYFVNPKTRQNHVSSSLCKGALETAIPRFGNLYFCPICFEADASAELLKRHLGEVHTADHRRMIGYPPSATAKDFRTLN